ncbi:hypothetical protein ACT17_34310 [Mycolicibacterium conceptionense]|uniref:Endonuclease n=1 Tax=Mycolicibacterium conceptionense TaxID=451644 RepID=A0A0J8TW26_9MYCO|nr:YraN family protein [Mycolicibacterium conceptionense]KMV13628.1 hypothetical protein ACT17_34310 [Mycolicibacterium conceptionense]
MSNPIDIVCDYVSGLGAQVLDRRSGSGTDAYTPDIVARFDGGVLAFVRVRARAGADTEVSPADLAQLRAEAVQWFTRNETDYQSVRIDIAAVTANGMIHYRPAAG